MGTTDAYLDARAAFGKINAEVKEFSAMLAKVSYALATEAGRFTFEDIDPALPLAAGLTHRAQSFPSSQWKSAEQIHRLLLRWHEAHATMTSAYNELPVHRRDAVQPPLKAT